jgi:hypothetical protein
MSYLPPLSTRFSGDETAKQGFRQAPASFAVCVEIITGFAGKYNYRKRVMFAPAAQMMLLAPLAVMFCGLAAK